MPFISETIANRPRAGTLINHAHRLSHGLVGCWPLNETAGSRANDASRNNFGSLVGLETNPWNATNLQASGFRAPSGPKTGLKWHIINATEYVTIPSSPLYDGPIGTWVLWMRTRQGFTAVNPLLMARHDATTSSNGATLYLSSGNAFLSAQLKTSGGTLRLQLDGNVSLDDGSVGAGPDKAERLVALSFSQLSGGVGTLWLDGRLHASGTNSGAWAFNGQEVRLGHGVDSFWARYGGAMGFVRWYNRTLSADEHRELYVNAYAGFIEDDGALAILAAGGAIPAFMHHYMQQRSA